MNHTSTESAATAAAAVAGSGGGKSEAPEHDACGAANKDLQVSMHEL